MHALFVRSQIRMVLSSLLDKSQSLFEWKMTEETLLKCPLRVSISHALVSLYLQSLIVRSSEDEAKSERVGWKATQLTPLSCPSRTNLQSTSFAPNMSTWAGMVWELAMIADAENPEE